VFLGLLTMRLDPATFVRQLGVGTESLAPAEIIPRGATEFAARVGLRGPLFDSNNIGQDDARTLRRLFGAALLLDILEPAPEPEDEIPF